MILALLATAFQQSIGSVVGPVPGMLSRGESLVVLRDPDGAAGVELRRGEKVSARTWTKHWYAGEPIRVLRHGTDHFLAFVGGWATGYCWEVMLVRPNPPSLKYVGAFENGALRDFAKKGVIRAYPKHAWAEEGLRRSKGRWDEMIRYTYHWNARTRRFVKVNVKVVTSMEPESERLLHGHGDAGP